MFCTESNKAGVAQLVRALPCSNAAFCRNGRLKLFGITVKAKLQCNIGACEYRGNPRNTCFNNNKMSEGTP